MLVIDTKNRMYKVDEKNETMVCPNCNLPKFFDTFSSFNMSKTNDPGGPFALYCKECIDAESH
jgi:hypothetical protein